MSVYRCPYCSEYVFANAQVCRFCERPLNPLAAIPQAEMETQFNSMYNEVMVLDLASKSMVILAVACFFPIGIDFLIKVTITMIVGVPLGAWRVWSGMKKMKADHKEVPELRSRIRKALLIWGIMTAIFIIGMIINFLWFGMRV